MTISKDGLSEVEKLYFFEPTISRQDLADAEKCGIYDDEGYEAILKQLKQYYNHNFVKGFKRGYEQCKKECLK